MEKVSSVRRWLRRLDRLLEVFVTPEFVAHPDVAPPANPTSLHFPRVC